LAFRVILFSCLMLFWGGVRAFAQAPSSPVRASMSILAGDGYIAVAWRGVTGATAYNVYRSTASGGSYSLVNATPYTGTRYVDTGLTDGTTYYYEITALNGTLESAPSDPISATPQVGPTPPTLSVSGVSGGTVSLTWSTTSGYSYDIYRATSAGGESNRPYSSSSSVPWSDTGLTNGTTYYYKITAISSGVEGALSNEVSAKPIPAPPTLTAVATTSQIQLSWTAPTGATSYILYRGTGTGSTPVSYQTGLTGTSYTDTGLVSGAVYTYSVSAAGTNWTGAQSSVVTSAALAAAPSGLVVGAGNAQISLNWTASVGTTGYNVKRSTVNGGPYTTVNSAPVAASTFTDTGLTNGTLYYYIVTALDAGGESASSNQAAATPAVAPGAPTGLTTTPGNQLVTISWSAVSNATSYNVKYATTSGGPYLTIAPGISGTSFTQYDLHNGRTYYYVVSANDIDVEGANSTEGSATPLETLPGSVTGLAATAGDGQVSLTWTPVYGARSYNIYRSAGTAGAEGPIPYLTAINSLPFVDSGLTNGTRYYYQVTAVNGSGESTLSTEVSAMPATAVAPTTRLTASQAIQIASSFCTTIGAPVTDTATATYPAPPVSANTEDHYWQPRWLVRLGTKAVVEVVDATSVVANYYNYDLSRQLNAANQAAGTPLTASAAVQAANTAVQATAQTEALGTAETQFILFANPATTADDVWKVILPRQAQSIPYVSEEAIVLLQAETGAVRSLSLVYPSPTPATATLSVSQTQGVSTAAGQLVTSGIAGATFVSAQQAWTQTNTFWLNGDPTPQSGAAHAVWICTYTVSGMTVEVWVDAQTNTVVGGRELILAGHKVKGTDQFGNRSSHSKIPNSGGNIRSSK
jgi:fibronectin type 3 domain-containing protein